MNLDQLESYKQNCLNCIERADPGRADYEGYTLLMRERASLIDDYIKKSSYTFRATQFENGLPCEIVKRKLFSDPVPPPATKKWKLVHPVKSGIKPMPIPTYVKKRSVFDTFSEKDDREESIECKEELESEPSPPKKTKTSTSNSSDGEESPSDRIFKLASDWNDTDYASGGKKRKDGI